jgi:peroxiredoxin
MALTPSTMLDLGTPAPDFALRDTDGNVVRRDDFRGAQGLLVMFICNHCPYVKHINPALVQLARDYMPRGLAILAISSNDAAKYPDDGPAQMAQVKRDLGYPFPYLYDESQSVAKAYRAACTPDFFLFDAQMCLVYRGQFDGSRPGNGKPVTAGDIRAAIDALLGARAIAEEQIPSVGCNIKWRPGNEPDYFG